MAELSCVHCIYFVPDNCWPSYGTCHRFPPIDKPGYDGRYLKVDYTDWCGEFEAGLTLK